MRHDIIRARSQAYVSFRHVSTTRRLQLHITNVTSISSLHFSRHLDLPRPSCMPSCHPRANAHASLIPQARGRSSRRAEFYHEITGFSMAPHLTFSQSPPHTSHRVSTPPTWTPVQFRLLCLGGVRPTSAAPSPTSIQPTLAETAPASRHARGASTRKRQATCPP